MNTYIKRSIDTKFAKELEKHKDDLRKKQVSEEKLTALWNNYRNYYRAIFEYKLINSKANARVAVNDEEQELVSMLEINAPFIPEKLLLEMERMIMIMNAERANIANGEGLSSFEQHNRIISLFREFLA